jgi:hypothetical protein
MKLSQPLSERRRAKRCSFAREYGALLEDNPGVLNVTWFDVACFHWMVTLARTATEEKVSMSNTF